MAGQHKHELLGVPFWAAVMATLAGLEGFATPARAEVTVFQQGFAPSAEYRGCVDTYIVGYGWAHDRPSRRPTAPTLRPAALMRFDISAIDKTHRVERALLRLYFASIPPQGFTIEVRTLKRPWDVTATWYEYKYKDAKKSNENNWSKFGGDLDESDFGQGAPGLVARAGVRGGPFGHIVELDVTKLVKEWVAGQRPNHGFYITARRGHFWITSSEWPIPAYRPALLVEHYKAGQPAEEGVRLELPPEPGPKAKLSALAAAAKVSGTTTTVRFGRNSNCHYRTGHRCGYAKQDPRYPGNWGWTPRLRAGGTAGDFNHALFYFDLSAIPKTAAVRRAVLRAFVDLGNMRIPPEALPQGPERPDPRQRRRMLAR